jgi:hypothetical protein
MGDVLFELVIRHLSSNQVISILVLPLFFSQIGRSANLRQNDCLQVLPLRIYGIFTA